MERSWADAYYDALEFFFWEPQHLGRKKYPESKLKGSKAVQKHLREIEVTLNHHFIQFFALAPNGLRNRLFETIFGTPFAGRSALHGWGVEARYELHVPTQPDLFFTSDESVVSVELKVGSKSSLSQVFKYALLGLAEELATRRAKAHYLAYFAPGPFKALWSERWPDVAALRGALVGAEVNTFLSQQSLKVRIHEARFKEIVAGMELGYLSYHDFGAFLENEEAGLRCSSEGEEVLGKLIRGLMHEIDQRGWGESDSN